MVLQRGWTGHYLAVWDAEVSTSMKDFFPPC